jgi:hypothetical protein
MLDSPQIPAIFTSATYRQDVQRPGNVSACFSEPLSFETLLAAVHPLLAQKARA